jgi:hypothetical protein
MGTPNLSSEEAPATLTTLARTLLFISTFLAGVLFGYGFMEMEDSSWIQIGVEVAVPALLLLTIGYVLVEDSNRRESW